MNKSDLSTKNEITWCPGCQNFLILAAAKKAISRIIQSGIKQEEIVMVTGIGCHAKIFDYLNLSGVYGLHGRALPVALGIKLANPKMKVVVFSGDGDSYAEGMEHFVHACRYNADITLIVHDNRAFSLTTGQATPTSQKGYKTKSEPFGSANEPINPIKIALTAGATFVARCNAQDVEHTSEIIEKAINHKGFSFIEIMQNCVTFNSNVSLSSKTYKIEDNQNNFEKAESFANEWNYSIPAVKIPIGIFYQGIRKTLEENISHFSKLK